VDYPACRLVDDIDNLGDGWRVVVTSYDDGSRLDERRVTRVMQKSPNVTGLVLVHEVAGDIDADHRYHPSRPCSPTIRVMRSVHNLT